MKIVHALEALPTSIFLAGPTPRDPSVLSWRPNALQIIHDAGFNGIVYVPESADWSPHRNYDAQIKWEWEALNVATVVVFWVPRDIVTMPAFTTNVEFGLLASSGKIMLGYPKSTPKMTYLHALAERFSIPVLHTLESLLHYAVQAANERVGQTTPTK